MTGSGSDWVFALDSYGRNCCLQALEEKSVKYGMKASAYRKQLSSSRRTQPAHYLKSDKCVIHIADFFSCSFNYYLLPHPFSSKELRREGSSCEMQSCLLSLPSLIFHPLSPPGDYGVGKCKFDSWTVFCKELPVHTIALLGELHNATIGKCI